MQIDPKTIALQGQALNIPTWCRAIKLLFSNGAPFGFAGHFYQRQLYELGPRLPFMAIKKGSQIGISEWAVIKSLHGALFHYPLGVLYYFPTDQDVTMFSKERFELLVERNPETIKQMLKGTDNVHTKRIAGRGHISFRGLKSKTAVKTAPADSLIYDELDEADPYQVRQAEERVSHSEYQHKAYLSTPTLPDYGIDAKFRLTDQRQLLYYCEACNKYTGLERDWPNCIALDQQGTPYRACRKCRKPLDMNSERNEWVPEKPGREYQGKPAVGWWLSQIHSPHVSLFKIWQEWDQVPKFMDLFYNHVLAQAYVEPHGRIGANEVMALCSHKPMQTFSHSFVGIGLDMGPKQHYAVVVDRRPSGLHDVLWLGKVDYNGADRLLEQFKDSVCVVDGLGDVLRTKTWAEAHEGQVFRCFYSDNPKTETTWDDGAGKVLVYATTVMDASHRILEEGMTRLPTLNEEIKEFARHCHNVARRRIEDQDSGRVYYTWYKLNADHYRRAFNFAVLACGRDPEQGYRATDMGRGDEANATSMYSGSLLNKPRDLADDYVG